MKTFLFTWVILVALYLIVLGIVWKAIQPPKSDWIRELTPTESYKLYLYEGLDWNYKQFRQMSKIAYCESRWIETAYNYKTGDAGLFQVNVALHGYIPDPYENIDYAITLYKKAKRQPWIASIKCWSYPHIDFLPKV